MLKIRSLRLRQPGFTLVELIAVIIMLGILSAVALPKFIDISAEANRAVLETMGGSILSASSLVYGKSLLQGKQNDLLANVDLDGDGTADVEVRYGYPSGSRTNGISKIMGGSFATEWTWSTNNNHSQFWLTTASLGGRSGVYINQTAVLKSGCYLIYHRANNPNSPPTISYVTTDC